MIVAWAAWRLGQGVAWVTALTVAVWVVYHWMHFVWTALDATFGT